MTDPRAALGLPPLPDQQSGDTPAPATDPAQPRFSETFDEALGSLTGWDEIEIAKQFRALSVYDVSTRFGELQRAVAYILARRTDKTAAPKEFMDLSILEVARLFAPPNEDLDGEPGKASSTTAT
jgi:hypothetical protein